jgi:polyhydroxybutyrate depolymerase
MIRRSAIVAGLMLFWSCILSGSTLAGSTDETITVQGIKRTYRLHAPPNLDGKTPTALVLCFHGGHGGGRSMEKLTKFSDLADRERFIVVYPEAYGTNWNDGRVIPSSKAYTENVDDLAFVSAVIDDVSRKYRVDARQIYATGISNGAVFSNYVGANLSDRVAAIAPVAGGIADRFASRFNPTHPVSVLIMQGTADPLMPYGGGDVNVPIIGGKRGAIVSTNETVNLWNRADRTKAIQQSRGLVPKTASEDGCTIDWTSWNGPNNTEVRLMTLNGGGHTWPGGSQYAPKFVVGNVCRDIDATQVIWNFFKQHPKS